MAPLPAPVAKHEVFAWFPNKSTSRRRLQIPRQRSTPLGSAMPRWGTAATDTALDHSCCNFGKVLQGKVEPE